jgi:hypothetical protein
MSKYIVNSIISIERRMQEILEDLHSIQEQIFYAYDPNEADTEVIQEEFESDQQAAFEYLVNHEE